jgi:hypothetical protein
VTDIILNSLALMLGRAGIASERDCARIRTEGQRPLIVLLISGMTITITTVAVDWAAPSLH